MPAAIMALGRLNRPDYGLWEVLSQENGRGRFNVFQLLSLRC